MNPDIFNKMSNQRTCVFLRCFIGSTAEINEDPKNETAKQRYRRKIKENAERLAVHLERERMRDRKRREIMKQKMELDENLKIAARIKARERMRVCRERRKAKQMEQTIARYISERTLHEVKVEHNLSSSAMQGVELVEKIAVQLHTDVADSNDMPDARQRKITDFFVMDNIYPPIQDMQYTTVEVKKEQNTETTRKQRYRRKIKEDAERFVEYLKRERMRDKKRREIMKQKMELDENLKIEARIRARERTRALRERKKKAKLMESISDKYLLDSAETKVKCELATSATKVVEVVEKTDFTAAYITDITEADAPKISDKVKKEIFNFFISDDVSRPILGVKDVTAFKKRIMIMSMREALQLFQDTFPEIFFVDENVLYAEKPAHIVPLTDTPHNIGICALHTNYINQLLAITKHLISFPKTHQELLKQVTCSVDNEDCMSNHCNVCKESNIWHVNLDTNPTLSWKCWILQKQRPKQIVVSKSLNVALSELQSSTDNFKLHCFVKNVQTNYFLHTKQTLTKGQAVIQIGFAENYTLVPPEEFNSIHWSLGQVTLFTCCIWTMTQLHSVIIVSDELNHDKYAVNHFLRKIFEYIKSACMNDIINAVHIFSDNCAVQFKNRYVLASMNALKIQYNFTHLEWNFFATSHAQRAVDGLAGSVKSLVWNAIKSSGTIVNSAQAFCDLACSLSKDIFIYVPKEQIKYGMAMLDWKWKGLKNIPSIQANNYFQFVGENSIYMARTALTKRRRKFTWKSLKNTSGTENELNCNDKAPMIKYEI